MPEQLALPIGARAPVPVVPLSTILPAARQREEDAEVRRHHRATDGGGSAAAAEAVVTSGRLSAQCRSVLDALRRHPGSTSAELAERAGLDRHLVGRRLPDLLERGAARRAQVGASKEWRWWAVEEVTRG